MQQFFFFLHITFYQGAYFWSPCILDATFRRHFDNSSFLSKPLKQLVNCLQRNLLIAGLMLEDDGESCLQMYSLLMSIKLQTCLINSKISGFVNFKQPIQRIWVERCYIPTLCVAAFLLSQHHYTISVKLPTAIRTAN